LFAGTCYDEEVVFGEELDLYLKSSSGLAAS
jgi:hypothetical protein